MSLAPAWLVLGRRIAVAAGASTALVSLLVHNTLLTASLRGAIALIAVLVIVRTAHSVMTRIPVSSPAKGKESDAPKRRAP